MTAIGAAYTVINRRQVGKDVEPPAKFGQLQALRQIGSLFGCNSELEVLALRLLTYLVDIAAAGVVFLLHKLKESRFDVAVLFGLFQLLPDLRGQWF